MLKHCNLNKPEPKVKIIFNFISITKIPGFIIYKFCIDIIKKTLKNLIRIIFSFNSVTEHKSVCNH